MKLLIDKIIQPLMSEKTAKSEQLFNEFSILVDSKMTKSEIKKAVELCFSIKPISVRTINFRKKEKRNKFTTVPTKIFKKALVRLPEGKRLEVK